MGTVYHNLAVERRIGMALQAAGTRMHGYQVPPSHLLEACEAAARRRRTTARLHGRPPTVRGAARCRRTGERLGEAARVTARRDPAHLDAGGPEAVERSAALVEHARPSVHPQAAARVRDRGGDVHGEPPVVALDGVSFEVAPGEIAGRNMLAADVAYELVQHEIRELTRV